MDHDDTPGAAEHLTARNGSRPLAAPSDDELDALADLFLGPGVTPDTHAAGRGARAPSPRRLRLEAVVLGHLPVSSSSWPGQYARRRAEALGGPVAVVRLTAGSLGVDLIGAGGPGTPLLGEAEALGHALAFAAAVLLRVDEPAEARLARLPGLDSLCLLTGADDAAVVACYRKLKAIAATGAGPLPPTHLTIMGTDARHGALAHQRIARAAREFLDADLLEPVVIDRIGPTGSNSLYHGPTDLTLEALVAVLTAGPPGCRGAVGLAATPPAPKLPTRPDPETPAASPLLGPLPRPTEPVPDHLTSLIEGLQPLETRCPTAGGVELGVDQAGCVHLVAASLRSRPALSSRDALADLLCATAWARTNAALLARAEPGVGAGEPGMHLVTDRPELATSLLGSAVRVHLAMAAEPVAFGLVAVALER